jgi:predicted aldo/keto reductase-like oxidoreductase
MQYRRFGRTELQIPVFSCGGMRYQYKWQDLPFQEIPQAQQNNLEQIIERSLEVGINHLETARGYGSSEMQLGKILPRFPREKLIIQTKVFPRENPQEFRQDFEKSLNLLNLDYVDLLGIHGVNNEELFEFTIKPNGCLELAKKLQEQGKVRFIGFSTHAPTDLIIKMIQTNQFDYINLHWYWINQFNWPAVETATRYDMGVFIISPSDKGGRLYEPSPKLEKLCQPLSPIVFNDLFCLSQPQIHTLSIGASRPSDFDEHLKTLPLLAEAKTILPEILTRLEEAAIAILGSEWIKTWNVGLPQYQDTPGNINIPLILWLRNLALAYDLTEYGKMRYNLLGNGNHWFPGEKATNLDDLDLSQCLINSPHRQKIPQFLKEADQILGGMEVKRLSQSD